MQVWLEAFSKTGLLQEQDHHQQQQIIVLVDNLTTDWLNARFKHGPLPVVCRLTI